MAIILSGIGLAVIALMLLRGVVRVPPEKAVIIERKGTFHRSLAAGVRFIVPFLDKVKTSVSLGEQTVLLTEPSCLSSDGRPFTVRCTLRWMITDPEKAVYSISDSELALSEAARVLLHGEIGALESNQLIHDVPAVTLPLTAKLRNTVLRWGIQLLGIEMTVQESSDRF